MMAGRRAGRRGAVAVGVAALAVSLASLAAPVDASGPTHYVTPRHAPACDYLLISPQFTSEHTVLCVAGTWESRGTVLYRSRDGGHSWDAGHVFSVDGAFSKNSVVATGAISPWFSKDHTLWLETANALYVSHNSGDTFSVLNTYSTPIQGFQLTPFVTPADASGPARVALLAWNLSSVGPPVGTEYVTVNGQPEQLPMGGDVAVDTLGYIIPPGASPSNPPLAVEGHDLPVMVNGPGLNTVNDNLFGVTHVKECPVLFTCTIDRFSTPAGRGAFTFETVSSTGRSLMETTDADYHIWIYQTADYGRTWSRMPSLERLLPVVPPPTNCDICLGPSTVRVTAAPDAPNRLFALVNNGRIFGFVTPETIRDERTPMWQLFRSDDAGAHWHRIGLSYLPGQRVTSRPTLPWNDAYSIQAEPGHRLYVTGTWSADFPPAPFTSNHPPRYAGMYCSTDDGRTWHTTCPA
jgi:hypothetical protein